MKTLVMSGAALMSLIFYQSGLADTASELEQLIQRNMVLTENEDIEGVLTTIHAQSPIYSAQENALTQINATYDLKYKASGFTFVASDDVYAYARFTVETSKVAGPEFRDNRLDILGVFRKEDGIWKFWNQMNLEIFFK